jgi:hypothetical protein
VLKYIFYSNPFSNPQAKLEKNYHKKMIHFGTNSIFFPDLLFLYSFFKHAFSSNIAPKSGSPQLSPFPTQPSLNSALFSDPSPNSALSQLSPLPTSPNSALTQLRPVLPQLSPFSLNSALSQLGLYPTLSSQCFVRDLGPEVETCGSFISREESFPENNA